MTHWASFLTFLGLSLLSDVIERLRSTHSFINLIFDLFLNTYSRPGTMLDMVRLK